MFEKTLSDMVRGLRAHRNNEAKFISTCIQEIKEELRTSDEETKARAIQKLTYLEMLGYDISWAAFNVVEVMSFSRFSHKRIGYLAASQSFTESTEVILLVTNQFKKDFGSKNQYEVGMALNCLANIATEDLARDLVSDVVAILNSARPYIRKRAVLTLYRLILKLPEALRPAFPRLKEKLEDPDPSVACAAVNIICELARRNPKNYLSLAPLFFKLLTTTSNNWMLIKIIKLLGSLCPLEPRLAKKLIDPLSNLISSTTAMSLLFECINTATVGISQHTPLIKLCMEKLRVFVDDSDQNLKYLGLVGMGNIQKEHPKLVAEHKATIMECLDDEDSTIRMRALDLVTGMVGKRNLQEITSRLMDYIEASDDASLTDELIEKLVGICSQKGTYQFVTNFQWYIAVLGDVVRSVSGTKLGGLLASQLIDVAVRVRVVRPFAVKNMIKILQLPKLLSAKTAEDTLSEVLYAAAWIVGEFSQHVPNSLVIEACEALLVPRANQLPAHVQGVFVQGALKLFASTVHSCVAFEEGQMMDEGDGGGGKALRNLVEESREVGELITGRMPMFCASSHLEVQERAVAAVEIVRLAMGALDLDSKIDGRSRALLVQLDSLFAEELKPVSSKAQRKVPVPDGIDLDEWIFEPAPPTDDEAEEEEESDGDGDGDESAGGIGVEVEGRHRHGHGHRHGHRHKEKEKKSRRSGATTSTTTAEEREAMEKRRADLAATRAQDPFYLGGGGGGSSGGGGGSRPGLHLDDEPLPRLTVAASDLNVDDIPIVTLRESDLVGDGIKGKGKKGKERDKDRDRKGRRRGKKGRDHDKEDEEDEPVHVLAVEQDDSEEDEAGTANGRKAVDELDVGDISAPVGASEVLPSLQAYSMTDASRRSKDKDKDKKKGEGDAGGGVGDEKEHRKRRGHGHGRGHKSKETAPEGGQGQVGALLEFDPLESDSPAAPAAGAAAPAEEKEKHRHGHGHGHGKKRHHKKK